MATDRIEIFKWGATWCAKHVGSKAASVRELFGTDYVPTSFSAFMPVKRVIAELSELNPGVEVLYRPALELEARRAWLGLEERVGPKGGLR